jgi:nucleotide-binding universal stress UspA family protein
LKILVAADGSPYTERTLAMAEKDSWLGVDYNYTILYVVPEMPMRAQSALDVETVEGYYAEEAERIFQPVREFLQSHTVHPDYVYKAGNPSRVIAQMAEEEGYDMIIMGTQGHGRLTNLVMGSVVTGVLARCEIPVLLVH